MSIDRKLSLTKRLQRAYNLVRTGNQFGNRTQIVERKKSPFIWPFGLSDTPQWSLTDYTAYYEEGFNTNSVIYAAVMVKVRAISQLDLVAAIGTIDMPEKIPLEKQHPLSLLLARPNPYMSENQYQGLQEVYLNLTGNAFGVLIRPNSKALPTEIWPLNPQWTQIIPDGKGGIKGYRYNPNGILSDSSFMILPSDMMHVKLPNPLDPLFGLGFGLSPLSPLAQSGDVDNQITKFLKVFFQKGAMPSGALKLKDMTLDDDSIAEIKQRWMEVYGGSENWTDIAVLDMTMEYERIGMTFAEMDFEKIDSRNESRMLLPFGVPAELLPVKLGLEGSTFANKEEARRWFWEDTMQYEMNLFLDVYQQYLSTDDGYFPIWDTSKVPALRKDVAKLAGAAQILWQMGTPAKIAYSTVGLNIEDYPGNDIGYLPFSIMPVSGSTGLPIPPTPPEPSGSSEENDSTEDTPVSEDEQNDNKSIKKNWTNDQKIILYKQFDTTAQKHEKPFGKACIDAFETDRRKILSIVNENKRKSLELKATVNFPDIENEISRYLFGESRENWRNTFTPVMLAELEDTGKFWSAQLGVQFDIRNIEGESWFTDYVTVFANPITDTSNEVIHDMISQAMSEGWSNDVLANRFDDVFNVWITGDIDKTDFDWLTNPAARPGLGNRLLHWRKEMIARTETTRLANAGSNNLFGRWGVKEKEWLATGDERTRDWHSSMSGQVVTIDGKFKSGLGNLLAYPGDPSAPLNETVQCRCTILPVIDDKTQITDTTQTIEEFVTPQAVLDTENRIAKLKNEQMHVFNKSGELILKKQGGKSSVRFTTEEAKKLTDNIVTHNHPDFAGTFSTADIMTAVTFNLEEIRAVGFENGKQVLYTLTRPQKGWTVNIRNLTDFRQDVTMYDFNTAAQNRKLRNDFQNGIITKDQLYTAWGESIHRAMGNFANKYQFIYKKEVL